MADITLVNLNLLFMRYGSEIERELHVPLGCLYLSKALEQAGFEVDFRDYQLCVSDEPFAMEVFLDFLADPAPVVGLSCMANLLPFTILAARAIKHRWPDRTVVLGGVGSKGVEELILRRFEWIDVICRGEGELTGPDLLKTLREGGDLRKVDGISFRRRGATKLRSTSLEGRTGKNRAGKNDPGKSIACAAGDIVHTPERVRIADIDAIGFPAWEKVDLRKYVGYGMMTSRGCPYPCTFCSVAPVWNHISSSRSPASIVAEMVELNERAGVDLFLFQDEFFVSGKKHVMEFCRELGKTGRRLEWKAFGRVNLIDEEMMRAMVDCGCLEIRFGVESGSDRILRKVKKRFTAKQVLDVIPRACEIFPRVDTFYIWGFPFETMEDFNQSFFQMVSFRMMGARILPSLLSLLPQTEIYRQLVGKVTLEFCPWLLPEFMFTGHEITHGGEVEIPERHREYFDLIVDNPDIFPGFFHVDMANNVLPKLALLRKFGFYPQSQAAAAGPSEIAQGQLTANRPPRKNCGR